MNVLDLKKERKVSWLELFFDLVFVTAVSSTTHLLLEIDEHPGKVAVYFGEYLLMVTPMFWAWIGQTMFFNRYGEKVKKPEIFMLGQMFFLILMTASFDLNFNNTFYTFIIGYAGIRLITVLQYFIVRKRLLADARHVSKLLGTVFLVGILISLSSVFFASPIRYFIMYVGISFDIIMPILLTRRLKKVPVDFPHLAERFGLFVIITFGESIVAITSLLVGRTEDLYTLLYTILSFGLIATLFVSYFHSFEHALDHGKETNGQVLLYGHYFIIVAIMILAANIHLLFAGHLEKNILLLFSYGAVAVFFVAKQIVFSYHQKAEIEFSFWKDTFLVLLLVAAFFINQLTTLPVVASFVSLWLIAFLDLALQFRKTRQVRAK